MRVLIIENEMSAYNNLSGFLKNYRDSNNVNYEVVKNQYYSSNDGNRILERDEIYKKIKEDIINRIDEFDILLMDLFIYDKEDRETYDVKKNQLVSIRIINELEQMFTKKNKKFFFVTGSSGDLEGYYEYNGMRKGWPVLHKPYKDPDSTYVDCPYLIAEFKPKCNFDECSIKCCFMTIIGYRGEEGK